MFLCEQHPSFHWWPLGDPWSSPLAARDRRGHVSVHRPVRKRSGRAGYVALMHHLWNPVKTRIRSWRPTLRRVWLISKHSWVKTSEQKLHLMIPPISGSQLNESFLKSDSKTELTFYIYFLKAKAWTSLPAKVVSCASVYPVLLKWVTEPRSWNHEGPIWTQTDFIT